MLASKQLKGLDIFSFLRTEQIDKISSAAEVIKLNAGENVYKKGDKAINFFIVLKGKVALLYDVKEEAEIEIDELGEGVMFGSCLCFSLDTYFLTAKSNTDTEVLKIKIEVLSNIVKEDERAGFHIQKKISEVYFNRYLAAMKKLREVVKNK